MPVRRTADPASVQNVWNAIRFANSQKQMADANRITKYLQKALLCTQTQAELYLKQTLQDGMIVTLHKITTKGSNAGNEVDSFRIPSQDQEINVPESHDWYCIDCHLAGDVSLCVTCHRVFHAECAHKNLSATKGLQLNRKSLSNSTCSLEKNVSSEPLLTIKTPEQINAATPSDPTPSETSFNNDHDTELNKTNENNCSSSENHNPIDVQIGTEEAGSYYDEDVCSICNMSRNEIEIAVEREELNYLLTFVYNRVRSWIPNDITKCLDPNDVPPDWYIDQERIWRFEKLVYDNITVPVVGKKLEDKEYRQPYEFKADMLALQHNIAIFHGTETQEYKASEFLLKDCMYEISELCNCLDCYKYSNEKVDENWFCIPCRIPHRLVWAKQVGHPYWPAKVLKENEKICDVRFFGGKYERAILSKTYIKPITVSEASLNIKRKPGFTKALKELALHQKLLRNSETSMDIKNVDENEEPEKTVQNKSISFKRKSKLITYKSPKTQKRSHSLDKLTENSKNAKTSKRRNSSATLNSVKSRPTEYPTRQTIQNLANKRKKRKSDATALPVNDTIMTEKLLQNGTKLFETSIDANRNNGTEENHAEVTSSSETLKPPQESLQDVDTKMPKPERQYSECVEKTRRKLEQCDEKDELIKVALESMQEELDRITNEHDLYLKKIFEAHNNQMSETKKKQWCYNCEQDAIYHCCWNTAYCSLPCQQQHWQTEHKKVCRRKR